MAVQYVLFVLPLLAMMAMVQSAPTITKDGNRTIPAGTSRLTLLGSEFPKHPSQVNITLRTDAAKSFPKPETSVLSIGKNGTSMVISISGLYNFHIGNLFASIEVTTRKSTGKVEDVKIGKVVHSPLIYPSNLVIASSVKTMHIFGERLGVSPKDNVTIEVKIVRRGEKTQGSKTAASVRHATSSLVIIVLDALTNKDVGTMEAMMTVNNVSSAWATIGTIGVGRLSLRKEDEAMLHSTGSKEKLSMTFGLKKSRERPKNKVGPELASASASTNDLGISEKEFDAIVEWEKGDIDLDAMISLSGLEVPAQVQVLYKIIADLQKELEESGGSECTSCSNFEFKCDNGDTIPYCWACDGTPNCQDGSDEKLPVCKKDYTCQGQNSNSEVIPSDYLCDGIPDCPDKDDETFRGCDTATTCKGDKSFNEFLGEYDYGGFTTTAAPSTTAATTSVPDRRRNVEWQDDYGAAEENVAEEETATTNAEVEWKFDPETAEEDMVAEAEVDWKFDPKKRRSALESIRGYVGRRGHVISNMARWLLEDSRMNQNEERRREKIPVNQEANVLSSGTKFVGANVYTSLNFELPTEISLRSQTCVMRVRTEMYWDVDEVKAEFANIPNAETLYDVDMIFTNLNNRRNLASFATSTSAVDCSKGFCDDHIPDGNFQKKLEFFAGTFTQEFDLKKYPFDTQVFDLNFTLLATVGDAAMFSPRINVELGVSMSEYSVSEVYCESVVGNHGTIGICRVSATRAFAPVLLNVLTPSILFVLIAIFSLHLDIKLAMPRIGSTLFALLILTQYRNAALASLPATDVFTWIDLYLFVCSLTVWSVLLLHIVADHLNSQGDVIFQRSLDKVMMWGLLVLLTEAVVIISVDHIAAKVSVGILLLVTVVAIVFSLMRRVRREHLKLAEIEPEKKRGRFGSIYRKWVNFTQPNAGNDSTSSSASSKNTARRRSTKVQPALSSNLPTSIPLHSISSTQERTTVDSPIMP